MSHHAEYKNMDYVTLAQKLSELTHAEVKPSDLEQFVNPIGSELVPFRINQNLWGYSERTGDSFAVEFYLKQPSELIFDESWLMIAGWEPNDAVLHSLRNIVELAYHPELGKKEPGQRHYINE